MMPLRFASLHLDQVDIGTFTLQDTKHAWHALSDPRLSRGLINVSPSKGRFPEPPEGDVYCSGSSKIDS